MQVLKFGGSSVKNAENISKVIAIVKEKVRKDKTIVVVSALGGITDVLLLCSKMASEGDEAYKIKLQEAEQRHLQTVKELVQTAGFNPIVAGNLSVSRTLEHMQLLLIQLNMKYNYNWLAGWKILHN